MNLYLMRHAEAEAEAEAGGDDARPLTERGRARTREAARGFRALGLRLDVILTSSLLRATETAESVADEYSDSALVQVLPALSPDVAPNEALAALPAFAHHHEVLVVGHEPQLSSLAALLLSAGGNVAIRLRKGACVALALPKTVEAGAAELQWMLTQRQLRKLRKR